MRLKDFLSQTQLLPAIETPDSILEQIISDLSHDSRTVQVHDLFFAYPGYQSDGREYVAEVLKKGVNGVIYEIGDHFKMPHELQMQAQEQGILLLGATHVREHLGIWADLFYGQPSRDMCLIGVTGTNGKTSVVHFIEHLLSQQNFKIASMGTLGVSFAGQRVSFSQTTPDPIFLHQTLRRLKDQGCEGVAMEVSSHALEQGRVAGIHFDAAILTNITVDHLDYHLTFEAYVAAKKKLFEKPGLKIRVLNQGDPIGRQWLSDWAGDWEKNPVWAYGRLPAADEGWELPPRHVLGQILEQSFNGMRLEFLSPWGGAIENSVLVGDVQLDNLLAVLTTLAALGFSWEALMKAIPKLTAPCGRLEHFGGGAQPDVFVDYAHTPDALERVLKFLKPLGQGRLWVVFGCGGDRDKTKRSMMARAAEQWADGLILTDDNPRGEPSEQIIRDICAGLSDRAWVRIEPDRTAAIRLALNQAQPGDAVLIAGKGHEAIQIRGQVVYAHSDQNVVQQCLKCFKN